MSYNYFPGSQIWVNKSGVDSYMVAPNNTVPLWDIDEQVIYLKSADSMGKPSVKILDYTVREIPETSDELADLRNEIANLKELVESLKKGKRKNEPVVSDESE